MCEQDNSQCIGLVKATLETLLKFLNWIPLGYIFETKLISSLIYKVCGSTNQFGMVEMIVVDVFDGKELHSLFTIAVFERSSVQKCHPEVSH